MDAAEANRVEALHCALCQNRGVLVLNSNSFGLFMARQAARVDGYVHPSSNRCLT